MIAPVFQIVNIGTQLTEAFAGLDRTIEILSEREERRAQAHIVDHDASPSRRRRFEQVEFAYEPDKPVLHGISFRGRARNRDRACRAPPARANPPSSA